MAKQVHIDFVSDVVCPWCVLGLKSLEIALERLSDELDPVVQLQPFELNPTMPREGQNMAEHIAQKYGRAAGQSNGVREVLKQRAEEVGFTFAFNDDSRIYNSFDAHRLLHWAGLHGRQLELKYALFGAYFTDGVDISDREALVARAESVGLDAAEARAVLDSDRYTDEVRTAEQIWMRSGVNSVPSIIVNRKYMISGGQTPAAFEDMLRRIAAEIA